MCPNLRATRLGSSGGSTDSFVKVKEVILNYNAALSFQPLPLANGDIVVSIDAEVITTFDAAGESVAVGLVGTPNKYFAPGNVNLNATGVTSKTVIDNITVASQILISFVRGTGGTQGQVRLLIRYVPQAQEVTVPFLLSIAVTPANPTVNGGGVTEQFTATGTFSDLSTQNITTQCVWASSDAGAATIGAATGLATTTGGGATTISATQGAVSGNTTLTVTAVIVSIAVSPLVAINPNIIVPLSIQQYKALATYSDSSTADITGTAVWSTTTPGIVSVVGGLVTGVADGIGNVRAVQDAITGNTTQDVRTVASVAWIRPGGEEAISPFSVPNTIAGYPFVFRVTFVDASVADVNDWVTFGSSNASILTVDGSGQLSAVADGGADAQATYFSVLYPLTVAVKTLVSILLNYPDSVIPQQQSMNPDTVDGTYGDATTSDVRDMATYASDDAIVTVVNTPIHFGQAASQTLSGISPAAAEDANLTATIGAITSNIFNLQVGEVQAGLTVAVDTNPVSVGNDTIASSQGTYNGVVGTFDLTAYTTFSSAGVDLMFHPPKTFTGTNAGMENVNGSVGNPNPGGLASTGFTPVTVDP